MRYYKGIYRRKKEKKKEEKKEKKKGKDTSKGLRRDTLKRRDRRMLMIDKKVGLRDILHFRNPRIPNHTLCGHNCAISGRTYSNVTKRIDEVTCSTCLNAIRNSKWLREMTKISKGHKIGKRRDI